MSALKVKTPAKLFTSNLEKLQAKIVETLEKIDGIVGCSLGPHGRNVIIESNLKGISNKNTKDGVTIFKNLGSFDPFEHLIIEQVRDAAIKTVNEAGDGTTSSTIIAAALTKRLFEYCSKNPKASPQRVARKISKITNEFIIPKIKENAIHIDEENQEILEKVATVSTNGDTDMAKAVIKAFDLVGYGAGSHVTIQELSGPSNKYEAELIEGYPIDMGIEESIGKFHTMFINDQGKQRCALENPKFVLFDGNIDDWVQIHEIMSHAGSAYSQKGDTEYKNIILVAHKFHDQVLSLLAHNFVNPDTINIVPLKTPIFAVPNAQLHFLNDLAAFTGATVFGLNKLMSKGTLENFGQANKIEMYRFRTTIIGDPDPLNIEVRAEELEELKNNAESSFERVLLEERLGKLTKGIAKLKIYGSTEAELKEKADRCDDCVSAVRSAIRDGALPGGGRILLNISFELEEKYKDDSSIKEVLIPALQAPFFRLLENAGYSKEEEQEIFNKLKQDKTIVYDIAEEKFGKAEDLGLFDSTPAVIQSVKNSVSIGTTMGTAGGIIAHPRRPDLELQDHKNEMEIKGF